MKKNNITKEFSIDLLFIIYNFFIMRQVNDNRIIDLLNDIEDNSTVTFCYIADSKILGTKRNIDDYTNDQFKKDLEDNHSDEEWHQRLRRYSEEPNKSTKTKLPFKGVLTFTRYTAKWQRDETYRKNYGDFASKNNEIRTRYGLEPTVKRGGYDEKNAYDVATGNTENTKHKVYFHLNPIGVKRKRHYFGVNENDTLTSEMSYGAIRQLFSKSDSFKSDKEALAKLEKTQEEIDAYISEVSKLKHAITKYELERCIFIIAEINGEQVYWWNKSLSGKISKTLELNDTSSLMKKAEEMFDMAEDQTINEGKRNSKLDKHTTSFIQETINRHIRKILNL